MKLPPYIMVFDVESVGLHGEAFSYGFSVVSTVNSSRMGVAEVAFGKVSCAKGLAKGTLDNHKWVEANCKVDLPICPSLPQMRQAFWDNWMYWKAQGAMLAADVPWPVEATFLSACVADDPEAREWQGPYPMLDIASIRMAAGLDPLGIEERVNEDELPAHDPLADSRQSARLLLEALDKLGLL